MLGPDFFRALENIKWVKANGGRTFPADLTRGEKAHFRKLYRDLAAAMEREGGSYRAFKVLSNAFEAEARRMA